MRSSLPLLALLVVQPLAGQSSWSRVVDLDLYGMVAPAGLQAISAYSFRKVLAGPGVDPLAYMQGGVIASCSPAFGYAGLVVEVQPAPFLVLRAEHEATRFFGQWGALLSLPTAMAPFGDADLKARNGQEESASGVRTVIQDTPQARLGQVVLRHQATFSWLHFGGRGPWFYDCENDTLLRGDDRIQDQQTFALWESNWGSLKSYCGATWQVTTAHASGLTRRRLGAVVSFEASSTWGRWGRPRGGLIVGQNQSDPNRKGELYGSASLGTTWTLP